MLFTENSLTNVSTACASGWTRCSKCCRSWTIFKLTPKNKIARMYNVHVCRDNTGLNHNHFWVIFLKKKFLLVGMSGMLWTGKWVSEWVSEWMSGWVSERCFSHQSDWIYYRQPIKFLVLLQIHVKWYFCLLASNGNLTRSQSSGTSRKMFGPIFS